MRAFAALLLIGLAAALAAPAPAQTDDPPHPAAPGPVPPPRDAPWPPANAGCGDDGPTMSVAPPTVRLTSDTLRLTPKGGVRIRLRGNQTAAMFVKISQVGGMRVGGTQSGTYTCTVPGNFINSHPLSDYGRRLVRRHGRLAVKLTFRIINGSGVTNKRVLLGVIRPEPAPTRATEIQKIS
jgi:hypothetical protein